MRRAFVLFAFLATVAFGAAPPAPERQSDAEEGVSASEHQRVDEVLE